MAKQGMKRPSVTHTKEKDTNIMPELQGKAKNTKEKANPIIADTKDHDQKVYHGTPLQKDRQEKPIPDVYPETDNDLARDNMENDIPQADLP